MSIHILLNRGLLLPTSEENCTTLIAHLSGLKTTAPEAYEAYIANMVRFWEEQKILTILPEDQLPLFERVMAFIGKETPVKTEEVLEATEETPVEATEVAPKKTRKTSPQS